MKKKIAGVAFVILSIFIMSVSAYVYEQGTQTIGQTVQNIATLTVKSSALGILEEGQTKTYTKADVTELGSAIELVTTKSGVVLKLNSDIEQFLSSNSPYTTTGYTVVVRYPGGATIATLTPSAPDASVTLGAAGSYVLDLEITTTAKSGLVSDQSTTATIIVTAESV